MIREFEEGKRYLVSVSTKFEGVFSGYEEDPQGQKLAVFVQEGTTDRGSVPKRRIYPHNVVESELVKGR
jgi:hypothetical protein